jgi:hypothetical protein
MAALGVLSEPVQAEQKLGVGTAWAEVQHVQNRRCAGMEIQALSDEDLGQGSDSGQNVLRS